MINVSKLDRFKLESTSKGTQLKWYKDGYYIKADKKINYEGLSEVICSLILKYTYNPYGYAVYFPSIIDESGKRYLGCYSQDFLNAGENLVSFDRLLKVKDENYIRKLEAHAGMKDEVVYAIDNLVKMFMYYYSINIFDYINLIFLFDLLVVNEDRHMNNFALKINSKTGYSFSPIFDNGMSLFSDMSKYRFVTNTSKSLKKAEYQPFGVSYEEFYNACVSVGMKRLSIDVSGLFTELNCFDFNIYEKYKPRLMKILSDRFEFEKGRLYC